MSIWWISKQPTKCIIAVWYLWVNAKGKEQNIETHFYNSIANSDSTAIQMLRHEPHLQWRETDVLHLQGAYSLGRKRTWDKNHPNYNNYSKAKVEKCKELGCSLITRMWFRSRQETILWPVGCVGIIKQWRGLGGSVPDRKLVRRMLAEVQSDWQGAPDHAKLCLPHLWRIRDGAPEAVREEFTPCTAWLHLPVKTMARIIWGECVVGEQNNPPNIVHNIRKIWMCEN